MHLISHTWSIVNLIIFLPPFSYMYLKNKKREEVSLGRFRSVVNFSCMLNYRRCTASFWPDLQWQSKYKDQFLYSHPQEKHENLLTLTRIIVKKWFNSSLSPTLTHSSLFPGFFFPWGRTYGLAGMFVLGTPEQSQQWSAQLKLSWRSWKGRPNK